MKSLKRAGQFNLRGKRTIMLSCKCCDVKNFKFEYLVKLAKQDIKELL